MRSRSCGSRENAKRMNKKIHFRNDRLLLDDSGRPFLCSKCPCGHDEDTYYVGYFCLCSSETPKLIGPASYAIYTRSYLVNNGYLQMSNGSVSQPCKNGRRFHPVGEGILISTLGHSHEWAVNTLAQMRTASLKAADECVRTCISAAHYHKNADTAGGIFNTVKLDFDGYTFELELMGNSIGIYNGPIFSYVNGSRFYTFESSFSTGKYFEIANKEGEEIGGEFSSFRVSASFRWDYGLGLSKYWMLDETVEAYTNRFQLDVSIERIRYLPDLTTSEETISASYSVYNCTEDALYTEDGNPNGESTVVLGQEFPVTLSEISIEPGSMHEKPKNVEDIQDPDWYNIYAMLGDMVLGFYFHWAVDSSSYNLSGKEEPSVIRIYDPGYDYLYFPDGCGSEYYYPGEDVPDDFE